MMTGPDAVASGSTPAAAMTPLASTVPPSESQALAAIKVFRCHSNVADALAAGDLLVVSPVAPAAAVPMQQKVQQLGPAPAAEGSGRCITTQLLPFLPLQLQSGSGAEEAAAMQQHLLADQQHLSCAMLCSPAAAKYGSAPSAARAAAAAAFQRWASPQLVTPRSTSLSSPDSLSTPVSPHLGAMISSPMGQSHQLAAARNAPSWPPCSSSAAHPVTDQLPVFSALTDPHTMFNSSGSSAALDCAYPMQLRQQPPFQLHGMAAAVTNPAVEPWSGCLPGGSFPTAAVGMPAAQSVVVTGHPLHHPGSAAHQGQVGCGYAIHMEPYRAAAAGAVGGPGSLGTQARPATATGGEPGSSNNSMPDAAAPHQQQHIGGNGSRLTPQLPSSAVNTQFHGHQPQQHQPQPQHHHQQQQQCRGRSRLSSAAGSPSMQHADTKLSSPGTTGCHTQPPGRPTRRAAAAALAAWTSAMHVGDGWMSEPSSSDLSDSEFESETASDSSDSEEQLTGALLLSGSTTNVPGVADGVVVGRKRIRREISGGNGSATVDIVDIVPRRRSIQRRAVAARRAVDATPTAASTGQAKGSRKGKGVKGNRGSGGPAAVRRTATSCSGTTSAAADAAAGSSRAAACDTGSTNSQYRGVTRHRRSGRWEAHLWIKELGRQVYLGGYEDEADAAQAYDLAALRSKGPSALTNFPREQYADTLRQLEGCGVEEMIMAVRRRSQGFSRGSSSYRGVTAHPSGRWESRIGIPGSRHVYLGLFDGEGEAAQAYDGALVRLRGLTAATNFNLAGYQQQLAEHYQLQEVLSGDTPEEAEHIMSTDGQHGVEFEQWIKQGAAGVGLSVGEAAMKRAAAELGTHALLAAAAPGAPC